MQRWEIKHRYTGAVLYAAGGETLRDVVVGAVKKGAYLRYADLSGANLGGAYLRGAYLRGAYLDGAYLGDAYLGDANLGGAYLGGAYLRGAYLGGAYLGGAYLGGADLRGADLRGAIGLKHWLTVTGLPSGDAWYGPHEDGWRVTVGCYGNRTLDELKALVAQDKDWPEAEGAEIERRRPGLLALISLCKAWEQLHPTAVAEYQAGLEEGKRIREQVRAELAAERSGS